MIENISDMFLQNSVLCGYWVTFVSIHPSVEVKVSDQNLTISLLRISGVDLKWCGSYFYYSVIRIGYSTTSALSLSRSFSLSLSLPLSLSLSLSLSVSLLFEFCCCYHMTRDERTSFAVVTASSYF